MHIPRLTSELRCLWPARATLGEGALWSPQRQALYWVDILGKQLHRYEPAGDFRKTWHFDEEISAVAERAQTAATAGHPGLIVTLRSGFAFFDPETGSLQPLHDPEPHIAGNRFNDGKCDAQGRFWGGTMDFACTEPTGKLYRFDEKQRCHLAFDANYPVTNGPTWSLDGRTLFFNETVDKKVHAFDFDPATGDLSNQRLWLRIPEGEGYPDGMTTDAAGRLWIAHWGGACITCHDPQTAQELTRIPLPTDHVSNCCFGGKDFKTLFITTARFELSEAQLEAQPLAGSLFAIDIDEPGRTPNLYAG